MGFRGSVAIAAVALLASCSEYDVGDAQAEADPLPCSTLDCVEPAPCIEVEPPLIHFTTLETDVDPPAVQSFTVRNVCEGVLVVKISRGRSVGATSIRRASSESSSVVAIRRLGL